MSTRTTDLYRPVGSAAADGFDVLITAESAGWGYSSLRVLTLAAGGRAQVPTGEDEMILLPLRGGGGHRQPENALEIGAGRCYICGMMESRRGMLRITGPILG